MLLWWAPKALIMINLFITVCCWLGYFALLAPTMHLSLLFMQAQMQNISCYYCCVSGKCRVSELDCFRVWSWNLWSWSQWLLWEQNKGLIDFFIFVNYCYSIYYYGLHWILDKQSEMLALSEGFLLQESFKLVCIKIKDGLNLRYFSIWVSFQ